MKYLQLITVSLFLSQNILAQNIATVHLDEIELRLSQGKDTTFVVNFWATWCAPCIKELPYFEALEVDENHTRKVLLVSLDFTEHKETKLVPFVKGRKLKSEVILLDELDDNVWIPRVSENWSGAIPATLFVNQSKKTRHFHEGSFKEGALESLLNEIGL